VVEIILRTRTERERKYATENGNINWNRNYFQNGNYCIISFSSYLREPLTFKNHLKREI